MNKIVQSPFEVSAHNPDWNEESVLKPGLLEWQKNAFNAVRGARFSFIVAFMGSGKSYVQLSLGVDEIQSSKGEQKQLVIVPQSHIHASFVNEVLYLETGVVHWKVLDEHKFLGSTGMTEVREALRHWLLTPGGELYKKYKCSAKYVRGVTAVTSHHALGLVWKSLTPKEKAKAIHNLTLRVDEAHHLNNILSPDDTDLSKDDKLDAEQESNNLGLVCSYIMKSKDDTAHLSLTTATPFRGDRDQILKKTAKAKFKVYYLPFFDHWKTLGIEKFGLEFLMYEDSPVQMCFDRIVSEPNERHMVVIPSSTRKWRAAGNEHQELIAKLNKKFPGQVLDLVTKKTQNQNKEILLCEPRKPSDGESNIRVVVTCMLGREGTDWCPCSRLHNLSVEQSITLAVQTLGRPFRRFSPVKSEVYCYNYVPMFEVPDENMSIREVLSNRTNALLTCMIFDEGFHPILLPPIPSVSKRYSDSENRITFQEALQDQGVDYEQFKLSLLEAVENNPDLSIGNRDPQAVQDAINEVLDEFGVKDRREAIYKAANQFLARSWFVGHGPVASELIVRGIDVSFLLEQGYDKLIEFVDDKDKSLTFTGAFAERDLLQLREMFDMSFDQRLADLASRWVADEA